MIFTPLKNIEAPYLQSRGEYFKFNCLSKSLEKTTSNLAKIFISIQSINTLRIFYAKSDIAVCKGFTRR